jgi:hypothetical protein
MRRLSSNFIRIAGYQNAAQGKQRIKKIMSKDTIFPLATTGRLMVWRRFREHPGDFGSVYPKHLTQLDAD